jgi:hypothetical protein
MTTLSRLLSTIMVCLLVLGCLAASLPHMCAAVLPRTDMELIRGGDCTQNPNLCVGTTSKCLDNSGYATCTRYGTTNTCYICKSLGDYTFCLGSDASHSCCVEINEGSPWCGRWYVGTYDPTAGTCDTCPNFSSNTCGRQYGTTRGGPCP